VERCQCRLKEKRDEETKKKQKKRLNEKVGLYCKAEFDVWLDPAATWVPDSCHGNYLRNTGTSLIHAELDFYTILHLLSSLMIESKRQFVY
jgi:hypothetical protein